MYSKKTKRSHNAPPEKTEPAMRMEIGLRTVPKTDQIVIRALIADATCDIPPIAVAWHTRRDVLLAEAALLIEAANMLLWHAEEGRKRNGGAA